MAVKSIIISKEEFKETVKNIAEKEGKAISTVDIVFNEDAEKDIVVLSQNDEAVEREVESFIPELNEFYKIDIQHFDGFDYVDFAGQAGGYVFIIN